MEVPLDYSSIIFWWILADVKGLTTEGKDYVLSRFGGDLLDAKELTVFFTGRFLDDHCTILVGVVGNSETHIGEFVDDNNLEWGDMDDGKLLIGSIPTIIDDEFALVVAFLAHIEHSACTLGLNFEVIKLLLGLIHPVTIKMTYPTRLNPIQYDLNDEDR